MPTLKKKKNLSQINNLILQLKLNPKLAEGEKSE
jgi:hypothetical protein